MRYGQPTGKIKICMIAELPAIQPVVLRNQSEAEEKSIYSISDESQYYPAPGLADDAFRYIPIEDADEGAIHHFPALVYIEDGAPWPLGNQYLTDLAFGYPPTPRATLKKVALSLLDHVNTMVDEEVDIFNFPTRRAKRPTYAYSQHLSDRVSLNHDSIDTSNQHISRTEEFYSYLKKFHELKPENEMWKELKKTFRYIDKHGFPRIKEFTTTDLRLKVKGRLKRNTSKRKLRAYNDDEQLAIIDALLEIGNTEMTLAFLTALTTGARKQSTFTMPRSSLTSPSGAEYKTLPIGLGSLIDAKYDSINDLHIPLFLVDMFETYLSSERYKRREEKSHLAGAPDNYIFLTKTGRPYYSQKQDPGRGKYKNPQDGGAIYSFIKNQLEPHLKRNNHDFNVYFHNLRATFANNHVKGLLEQYEKGKISMSQVVMSVNDRLGHSTIETTERYIEDIKREKIQALSQDKWERFLEERIRRSFGGQHAAHTAQSETDHPS